MQPGNRVRDRGKWGGTETGTVTRVDDQSDIDERRADGDDDPTRYVYIKWDGTSFSEDQLHPDEVQLIPGTGDTEVGFGIFVLPDGKA